MLTSLFYQVFLYRRCVGHPHLPTPYSIPLPLADSLVCISFPLSSEYSSSHPTPYTSFSQFFLFFTMIFLTTTIIIILSINTTLSVLSCIVIILFLHTTTTTPANYDSYPLPSGIELCYCFTATAILITLPLSLTDKKGNSGNGGGYKTKGKDSENRKLHTTTAFNQ